MIQMQINQEELPWCLLSGWLNPEEAFVWKQEISRKLLWEQPVISIYVKKFFVPRKTAFLGDDGITYSYSGHKHYGFGWPSWFLPLLSKVRDEI